MSGRPLLLLLACLMPLAGCAAGTVAATTSPTGAYQNWQIQSGNALTSPPVAEMLLVGALQVSGTQVSATNLNATALCPATSAPLIFTGTLTSAGVLTLNSTPITQQFTVNLSTPPTATSPAAGTIGETGTICALALRSAAVGTPVASLTGTFAGSVTASTSSPAYPTGTVSVALTQSATPNASGQFPLAGTLSFTSGTCASSTPVTGTVGGLGFSLASASNYVTVTGGGTTPSASQLTSSAISFPGGPCPASSAAAIYSGTLMRQ